MRGLCLVLVLLAPRSASAGVTLLVGEVIGAAREFSGGGHAAIYFSHVCADDLVTVRSCRAGESGVVLSTYARFAADFPYYWVAAPLSVFLFGVASPAEAPIFGSPTLLTLLRADYSKTQLLSPPPVGDDNSLPEGRWRSVVGTAFARNIYAFSLETSPEQDARAIAALNEIQHRRQFEYLYNNCADFARFVLNTYFPGAVHRDLLNDFSFTTPKAIARTLTSYGRAHPEAGFEVGRYRQLDGPIGRSHPNRSLTEKAVTSRKYLALSLATNPIVTAVFAGLYATTGRFSFERTFERSAAVSTKTTRDDRASFNRLVSEAIDRGLFRDRKAVKRFAGELDLQGEPEYGPQAELRLRVNRGGETRFVGLTRTGIIEAWSDPLTSYQFLMSIMALEMDESRAHAMTREDFGDDLRRLQTLHDRSGVWTAPPESLSCAKELQSRCAPIARTATWRRLVMFLAQ